MSGPEDRLKLLMGLALVGTLVSSQISPGRTSKHRRRRRHSSLSRGAIQEAFEGPQAGAGNLGSLPRDGVTPGGSSASGGGYCSCQVR